MSNRILLPRFGPKPIVPIGLLVSAAALFGLHLVGLHSSYVSHVLPYLLVLGIGFGLSVAPSFSTGTLGLAPQDAGVGSATLNTAQQVGGSIGTSLLNTLAAGAATSYLVGRALTPANLQAALLHSYTTAFLWSSLIFVAGAVVAGLVFRSGGLAALASEDGAAKRRVSRSRPECTPVEYGWPVVELLRFARGAWGATDNRPSLLNGLRTCGRPRATISPPLGQRQGDGDRWIRRRHTKADSLDHRISSFLDSQESGDHPRCFPCE